MKHILSKDKKVRCLFTQHEKKQKLLQSLKHNHVFPLNWWARHKLGVSPKRHPHNRCILTGRGRSPLSYFKLSRLEFRRWAYFRRLPGLRKSSW